MARTAEESAATAPATTETTAAAPAGEAAASGAGTRARVILTLDAEAATAYGAKADGSPAAAGDQVNRKDYILRRWSQVTDKERGTIAKELTRLEGRSVPYQIVFQATKGVTAGKVAAAPVAAPAPEAAAS